MLRRVAAIIGLTAMLAFGLVGGATASPSHVSDPCIKVQADVEPHHAHVGDVMSVGGSWINCGPGVYVRAVLVITGPCNAPGRIVHGHMRLRAGEGIGVVSAGFHACKGTYRATATAYHDGLLVDRMSRRVHVRPG